MKIRTKLIAGAALAVAMTGTTVVVSAVDAPALPAEQQALVIAGYTKTASSWAKFEKQDGACRVTVEQVGKNYYVFTSGKRVATLYPVIPSQVVAGAALMDVNCQG
jgi:hypothetical protein